MGANMRQLSDVDVFVRVVESGSYASAAKGLGISRSHASRMVTALEARLGVRLLHRTTRRISTTQTGQTFYDTCSPLLEALVSAEARAAAERDDVVGTLRISAPAHFGLHYLAAPLARFQATYPGLQAILDYSDRKVDLVAESYDLAIRGGAVENTSLVAKRLWPFRVGVYGSAAYLAAAGRPRAPAELAAHRCLLYTGTAQPRHWRLRRGDEEAVAVVSGPMSSSSSEALVVAAQEGLGLIFVPDFCAARPIEAGLLEPVMPSWSGPTGYFWAVRPHRTHLPARVRLFIDFLAALWPSPPWLHAVPEAEASSSG